MGGVGSADVRPYLDLRALVVTGVVVLVGRRLFIGMQLVPLQMLALLLVVLGSSWLLLNQFDHRFTPAERVIFSVGVGLTLATFVVLLTTVSGIATNSATLSHDGLLFSWALVAVSVVVVDSTTESRYPKRWSKKWPEINVVVGGILLVLLTLLGAHLLNAYGFTLMNYGVVVGIAGYTVVLLRTERSRITYCTGLYFITVSLLYSYSLVTHFAVGADIRLIAFFAKQIQATGSWTPWIGSQSQLSVVTAVPASIATLTGISVHWVYKVLFPAAFAVTPVSIYLYGTRRFPDRYAVLGGLAFATYFRVFQISAAKQHMAELLFALMLLLLLSDAPSKLKMRGNIVLSFVLVQAHYGVAFILSGILLGTVAVRAYWSVSTPDISNSFWYIFTVVFNVLTFSWYLLVGSGSKVHGLILALNTVYVFVRSGFQTQHRSGIETATGLDGPLLLFNKLLFIVLLGIIGIAVLVKCLRIAARRKPVVSSEFDTISLGLFGLVGASVFINGWFGMDRALDLALICLGVEFVYGLVLLREYVWEPILRLDGEWVRTFGVWFFVALLLFNTGFANQVAGQPVSSAIQFDSDPNSVAITEGEMKAAKWLVAHRRNASNAELYADWYAKWIFEELYPPNVLVETVYPIKGLDGEYRVNPEGTKYIFIQRSAIGIEGTSPSVRPFTRISEARYERLVRKYDVVYSSETVVILHG